MRFSERTLWLTGVGLVLVLTAAAERVIDARGVDRHGMSVAAADVSETRLDRMLRTIGVLRPALWGTAGSDDPSTLENRPGPQRWVAGSLPAGAVESRHAVPQELIDRGLRIVSIVLTEGGWRHMHSNVWTRGPSSEQPAWMTLFADGKEVAISPVGVRIQGNYTRPRKPERSYQLLFHRAYGANPQQARNFGWDHDGRVTRVILARDTRSRAGVPWRFLNPLAFDIARRLGAVAPETAPAMVFVNGRKLGLFFLTERPGDDFLERHYGHKDFMVVDTKRMEFPNGMRPLYEQLLVKSKTVRSASEIESMVDLDNLMRWAISIGFCGNEDEFQGLLVRALGIGGARWQWINWDMDHSFVYQPHAPIVHQSNKLRSLLLTGHRREPRRTFLRRLWRYDPSIRPRMKALVTETLDERVTDAFLAERLAHYRRIADEYGVEDKAYLPLLEAFVSTRRQVFRQQFDALFAEPSQESPERKRWRRERLKRKRGGVLEPSAGATVPTLRIPA